MSYLTQAFLDFETARVYPVPSGRGLCDLYRWHQLVWTAFPNHAPDAKRDFLTRLDAREREHRFRLLIVSAQPPTRPSAWPDDPDAWQTRPIGEHFFQRCRYRFQLRVNPTKRSNANRNRLPLETDEDLHAWLGRKGQQHGFAPDMATVRTMREPYARFRIESSGREGTHHSVNFDGELAVSAPAAFQQACLHGIGSAKAFGFGLLAVVPVAVTSASKNGSEPAAEATPLSPHTISESTTERNTRP